MWNDPWEKHYDIYIPSWICYIPVVCIIWLCDCVLCDWVIIVVVQQKGKNTATKSQLNGHKLKGMVNSKTQDYGLLIYHAAVLW